MFIPRRDFDGFDYRADVASAETTVFAQTLLELHNAITVACHDSQRGTFRGDLGSTFM